MAPVCGAGRCRDDREEVAQEDADLEVGTRTHAAPTAVPGPCACHIAHFSNVLPSAESRQAAEHQGTRGI